MMYSVPELPTCIPSFIASDSTVLARSGTYRRGMSLGGSFSSSLSVFSPLLIGIETSLYDRHNTISKEFIAIMAIVAFFFCIICIVEFCHWCNLSFIQGIRANERRIDMRSFFFFVLVFFTAYIPTAYLHFQMFGYMKCFNISMDDKDLEYTYWNKTQVLYECCGIHDYTYWGPSIPYSCCVHPQVTNCSANISNVYQKGCLQDVNIFVNDQVRFQTSNAQLYCLTVGVLLLVIGLIALHFSRKVYCGILYVLNLKE